MKSKGLQRRKFFYDRASFTTSSVPVWRGAMVSIIFFFTRGVWMAARGFLLFFEVCARMG